MMAVTRLVAPGPEVAMQTPDRATGQTKNVLDAEFFERADDCLRAGHHRRGYDVVRPKDGRGSSMLDAGVGRSFDAFRSLVGSSGLCGHQRGADRRSFAHRTLPLVDLL
jgi:hypothetical protein